MRAKTNLKRLSTLIMVAVFWVTAGLLWGCGSQKDKEGAEKTGAAAPSELKEKAKAAGEALSAAGREQKGEYEHQLEGMLHYYDQKIKELEAKAAEMTSASKSAVTREVQGLKEQEKQLVDELKALKADGTTAWEEAQRRLDETVHDLKRAYNEAASHIQ